MLPRLRARDRGLELQPVFGFHAEPVQRLLCRVRPQVTAQLDLCRVQLTLGALAGEQRFERTLLELRELLGELSSRALRLELREFYGVECAALWGNSERHHSSFIHDDDDLDPGARSRGRDLGGPVRDDQVASEV